MREVVALTEQWQTLHFGQRKVEHIAKVQPRLMATALTVGHKRPIGSIRLGLPQRN